MRVLAIESSCDETSAAVVEKKGDKILVHSTITATSLSTHAKTGGIIPENAAREQVEYIMPVIVRALNESKGKNQESWEEARKVLEQDIDAIAVTHGPGLIGSLLVGVETAKTLSFAFRKPLIPVNHLLAHLFANFISTDSKSEEIHFPLIGLIVSGGHTDLLLFKTMENFTWLGGTRDDAAGEALDKIGRLLGLSYPAGADVEERAKLGHNTTVRFHAPLLGEDTFDFSFSGLKSETMRYLQKNTDVRIGGIHENMVNEICFAIQKAVLDVLVRKTLKAAEKYGVKTIVLGGGVSANQTLLEQLRKNALDQEAGVNIIAPEKTYCTDNAAMIGACALLRGVKEPWEKVYANPELYFV